MPTIVTTASAADFLAVVPHLVGFEPQNSIVFVAFHGRRTCGAMRFDLPDEREGGADDPGSKYYKRVATTLVGMLSKLPGVESVVPVVYTADPFGAGGPPRASFVSAVVARFEFSGFDVRDALCVAADGWGSYVDEKCPPGGRPLDDIAGSRVFDELAEHEKRPLGAIDQWAALPEVAASDRRRVALGVSEYSALIGGRILLDAGDPDHDQYVDDQYVDDPYYDDDRYDDDDDRYDDDEPDDDAPDTASSEAFRRAAARFLRGVPSELERILGRGEAEFESNDAGFVIALAQLPALRDVVMLQWAFDLEIGERVLDDARSFAFGARPGDLETAGLMLGQGPRPDPERIDRAIDLLKRTAALSPRRHRPPVLSILAWLSWALGRSSVAKIFVTAAEEIDPGYGFADLMHTVLERGMLPEWAFARDR